MRLPLSRKLLSAACHHSEGGRFFARSASLLMWFEPSTPGLAGACAIHSRSAAAARIADSSTAVSAAQQCRCHRRPRCCQRKLPAAGMARYRAAAASSGPEYPPQSGSAAASRQRRRRFCCTDGVRRSTHSDGGRPSAGWTVAIDTGPATVSTAAVAVRPAAERTARCAPLHPHCARPQQMFVR